MKQYLRNLPIKHKLTGLILVVCSIILVVCFTIAGIFQWKLYRSQLLQNLKGLSQITADNCGAALLFQDTETLQRILRSLRKKNTISCSAVLLPDKTILVSDRTDKRLLNQISQKLPAQLLTEGYLFDQEYLELLEPVIIDRETIGFVYIQASMKDLTGVLAKTGLYFLFIISCGFFLAIFLANRVQKVITNPIHNLVQTIKQVGETKDYTIRVEQGTQDELGLLSSGFNEMLGQIQLRDDELESRVSKRTAELREARDEAIFQADKALAASKAKSQFLANMSHEIRTPLHAVIGMSAYVLQKSQDTREKEKLEIVKKSADNLLGLLNDILDFSKMEAGQLHLEGIPFNLQEAVKNAIETMTPIASEKNLKINYQSDPNLHTYYIGDELRIRQILLNLVGNGVKFTDKGSIDIRAELQISANGVDQIQFQITDTGVGIAPDKIEKIFRSFEQADSSNVRTYGGSGLGLAICKQIVELMGGKLWVESTLNAGSTFYFTLFLTPCDESDFMLSFRTEDHERIPALSILIVDDNDTNRKVAKMVLEEQHTVYTATTGLEALEHLANHTVDAVLMDVQMPGLDGIDTTIVIRQAEKKRLGEGIISNELEKRLMEKLGGTHLPVIALTAHAMEDDRKRCQEAGMNDYVTKPFTLEQLHYILKRVIWRRDASQSVEPDYQQTIKLNSTLIQSNPEKCDVESVVRYIQTTTNLDKTQAKEILSGVVESISSNIQKAEQMIQNGALSAFAQIMHKNKGNLLQCGLIGWADFTQSLYDSSLKKLDLDYIDKLATLRNGLQPLGLNVERKNDNPVVAHKPHTHGNQHRFLLLDDEPAVRRVVSTMLQRLDHEVDEIDDGASLVDKYTEAHQGGRPYDMVLVDLNIPGGLGGFEAATQLLKKFPDAHILACSGDPRSPVMLNPKKYGLQGSLPKPITSNDLKNLSKAS